MNPSDVPTEEEIDRVFAENHARAVLELAIETRDREARVAREAAAAAQRKAAGEIWCMRCRSYHVKGASEACNLAEAEERQVRAEMRAREKEQREKEKGYWTSQQRDRIPSRFRDSVADHPKVHAWVHRWESENEDDIPGRDSMLLTGPVGTGKTFQMFGILNFVAGKWHGEKIEFANVPALLTALRPGGIEEDLEKFKRADWLFLDDLTGHKSSEWAEERLYELINYRYEHQRATILTTNAVARDLASVLGDRIASRLAEMCEVVAITGKDRRRVKP